MCRPHRTIFDNRELEASPRGLAIRLVAETGSIDPQVEHPFADSAPNFPTGEKSGLAASEADNSRKEPRGIAAGLDLKAGCSVSEMEKQLIQITLAETDGNRTHAAKLLGISLRTLRNKLRQYRLAEALVGVVDE